MEHNRAGAAALRFHEHSAYRRIAGKSGMQAVGIGVRPHLEPAIWERDWSVEPYPFKEYETLRPIPLPETTERSSRNGLDILAGNAGSGAPVNLSGLARIARYAAGTLDRPVPGRDGRVHTFRAAGGTGARYHLELYFICAELADLPAGIYHYAAVDDTLRRIRAGDHRAGLIEATGHEPAVAEAPVVAALTSTFWRNAWRYRERAYRHAFWDAGTTLSQVVAVAGSSGLAARVVLGYADPTLNALLDVDGEREATVALCAVGAGAEPPPPAPATPPLGLPTRAISAWEETFADIPRAHAATSLGNGAQAAAWRAAVPPETPPGKRATAVPVVPADAESAVAGGASGSSPVNTQGSAGQPVANPWATLQLSHSLASPRKLIALAAPNSTPPSAATVEELVVRRRSVRHYDTETPTPFAAFSALLRISAAGFSADCLPARIRPYTLYLIVNAVEGLEPGLYVHHPDLDAVELLRAGDFSADAQRIAVGQDYPARAHVNAYYLTDLEALLDAYGERGYRLAQLSAALDAGRLHLACPAYGCGAVGSTSFDDEVIELFSPHADGQAYLFVTVFGKRRSVR